MRRSTEADFWSKVDKSGECWVWTGMLNHDRYGRLTFQARRVYAHRLSYELTSRNPIPEGLFVLHKCDNPPCVKPDHLWIGTKKENSEDALRKGRHYLHNKTSCVKGHEWIGNNVSVRPNGKRRCKACDRDYQLAHYKPRK